MTTQYSNQDFDEAQAVKFTEAAASPAVEPCPDCGHPAGFDDCPYCNNSPEYDD